jgi:hypothetical protein
MTTRKSKPGPKADRLKIEGDWKKAVGKAISVEKPAGGWPKPASRYTARSRKAAPK